MSYDDLIANPAFIKKNFFSRPDALPQIFTTLGLDYDDRVLPSITNEVLKAVVAQFDAGELITQREMVSARVNSELTKRAEQVKTTE